MHFGWECRHPFVLFNIKIRQWYGGKSAQEHYKNFHNKFNSCTRVFTLSGHKFLGMIEQAHNFCVSGTFLWGGGSPGSTCRKVASVGHWITQITTLMAHFMLPVIGLLLPCAGQYLLELHRHVSTIWKAILGCQNQIMCICSTEVQGLEIFPNSSIWLQWQAHFPSLHQPVKGQQIRELQRFNFSFQKEPRGLTHRAAESRAAQRRSCSWDGAPSFKRDMWEHMGHAWVGTKATGSHSTGRETSAPLLAATRILA